MKKLVAAIGNRAHVKAVRTVGGLAAFMEGGPWIARKSLALRDALLKKAEGADRDPLGHRS